MHIILKFLAILIIILVLIVIIIKLSLGRKTYSVPFITYPTKEVHNYPIPSIIHRTSNTRMKYKSEYIKCYKKCKILNPEYHIYWYDDQDCEKIVKNYDSDVYEAYSALKPTAFKCDLFRLVVLYKWGGVYIDDKTESFKPLNQIFEGTFSPNYHHQFISAKEKFGIHNGFIACTPKHPFIKQAIDDIVINVQNRDYTDHFLGICGPLALARSVLKCIKHTKQSSSLVSIKEIKEILKSGLNKCEFRRMDSNNEESFYLFDFNSQDIKKGRKRIMIKKYSIIYMVYGKILDALGGKGYKVKWYIRDVY